jgi:predicted SAM-dependent methyltransferase
MSDSIFNEAKYLEANPDVAAAVKEGKFCSGREHYEIYGKREGRQLFISFERFSPLKRFIDRLVGWISKPLVRREDKVFHLIDKKGLGLEIGPSYNPIAPKKAGFNVRILDHATREELIEKYRPHGVNLNNIEEVDFVWHGEPLSKLIGKTSYFDWIIASHVIEHVPDLISFLQQCEALLKPDGILSLVIPDKRYCFDYFSEISSTGHVLDTFTERRVRPSHGQVFDHFVNASKRKGNITWLSDGLGGADELIHTFAQAQEFWARSASSTDYIDVHCWRFTPASFRLLVSDLINLHLINMEIKAEFDTTNCEFYVSLGKESNASMKLDRLATLQMRKLENA